MTNHRSRAGTGFEITATYESAPSFYVPLERKTCEFCGQAFIRPIPADAKSGRKYCDHCLPKLPPRELRPTLARPDFYGNRPKHYSKAIQ